MYEVATEQPWLDFVRHRRNASLRAYTLTMGWVDMKVGDLIFVYGTLRRGLHNHRVMGDDCTFLDYATCPDVRIYDINGYFPGVQYAPGYQVLGELFQIEDESVIERLDRLEGHPRHYRREIMPTSGGPAWIYIYQFPVRENQAIPSGDWKKRGPDVGETDAA